MFKYALNLVLRRKMRTFLTSLGIMIAVMLMTFILFGMNDLQNAIIGQFSAQFKPTELSVSNEDYTSFGNMAAAPKKNAEEKEKVIMDQKIYDELKSIDGVKSVDPVLVVSGVEMYLEGDSTPYPSPYLASTTLRGDHHIFKSFVGEDTELNDGEIFVSNFVSSFYELSDEEIIGKNIIVKSAPSGFMSFTTKSMLDKEYVFKVIGVTDSGPDAFWVSNDEGLKMLVELGGFESADEYISNVGYNQFLMNTQEDKTKDVENYINEDIGLSVVSTETLIDFVSTLTGGLTIALFLFGAISGLVASIGIINTMIMSIYEQTKEIGIIKAIGASDFQVLVIFLLQSAFIGLLGGILGLGLTYLIMIASDPIIVKVLSEQGFTSLDTFFHFQPINALYITLGSILIGIIAGIYPSMKAAKLDPVKALRYE